MINLRGKSAQWVECLHSMEIPLSEPEVMEPLMSKINYRLIS